MLADANIALSRRGSLQADTKGHFHAQSTIGSPTSSSRASLDLDTNSAAARAQNVPNPIHLSHDALNQGYYDRFFVEQRKLGRGFRGSVFLCQHILDGIHLGEYAIKKVAVGNNHDWLVQMLREVHLLERLHHPNIVSYKHAWLENHQLHKFGPEVTCLFILMECANGGNLEEYIEQPLETTLPTNTESYAGVEGSSRDGETTKMTARERLQTKRQRLQGSLASTTGKGGEGSSISDSRTASLRRHLSITEIWSFFFDICEGLAHLHRLGIIHRDLKPPNLLLSYSDSQVKGKKGERPRILITDFGECEILDQKAKRDRTGATGTLEFLAPELLAVDVDGRYTDEFSFKGDMWSLGMVLYYLCYSRLPYSQIEDVDILRKEIRQFKSITIPEDGPDGRVIPEELKILIRVLLSPDKSKRPSCDDILSKLSHQRDRMMHGDMDMPTAPARSSSPSNAENSPSRAGTEVGDAMEIEDDSAEEVSEERVIRNSAGNTIRHGHVAPAGSSRNLQIHRRHSHQPVRNNTVGGSDRRLSRTTLVTENLKSVPGHAISQLSPSFPASARSTASPSVNLHKRVKPLGIGLRYMLRRKMMHPAVPGTSSGIQRQPRRRSSDTGRTGNGIGAGSGTSFPIVSFPLALRSSRVAPMATSGSIVKSISPTQEDMMRQQQVFRARKLATDFREPSALGLGMELAPARSEPQSSGDMRVNKRSREVAAVVEDLKSGTTHKKAQLHDVSSHRQ
ncbi:kinase-like domain-containing protein [Gamsiella multidivaricata]|uniref:kinase-like domain-containing protein n=1 Tax=Gamsiella multidivaricata TaxID=101098 RepID=UPI00221F422E|nr:kinase-like domain-containing protein [Gamsiella multidivaricata]KAI7817432.1 kinase-like domain-containing protein [Gamsiella multidivaricata]